MMTMLTVSEAVSEEDSKTERKKRALKLLQEAAAKEVSREDPWAKHNIPSIPAERIIRHLYNPETHTWTTDETICKIEKEPFTHGAMRFCYRMKKRAQPPASATNHRFHKHGWSRASNYVAKAYQKDGEIDTSEDAKKAVQNDIILQYEASHWAKQFNEGNPPTKIIFIRAYAIEFPNRPGKPWMAVERFIAGQDWYGAGFVKHNTNSGFVDTDLHRVTPQVFSAHSFHASQGQRLVADIQGVGDLYTDPQVLSIDYRFGDGDLGPRGMALFFKSFRHCGVSDSMGIPIFPLSKNELKVQAKYEEDEETLSSEEASYIDETSERRRSPRLNNFQRLDLNRLRRSMALKSPRDLLSPTEQDTERRANLSREAISQSFRASMKVAAPPKRHLRRTKSDFDEVQACLERAKSDCVFSHRNFHRHASGELRERHYRNGDTFHKSNLIRAISAPMMPTEETIQNLGKVHYQLAVLHGSGRFPEVVPDIPGQDPLLRPEHDAFSVLFHLSHAAAHHNAPACLALGRAQAGLETTISGLLNTIVSTNFDDAKHMLRRAMSSPQLPSRPKAAAGCLYYQILQDETKVQENGTETDDKLEFVMAEVLKDTIELVEATEKEANEVKVHRSRVFSRSTGFQKGDKVEANFSMEGTYYSGVVVDVSDDGETITVKYDDDGSDESHSQENVRPLIPPTATQTTLGGPLSDEEAFGGEHTDDKFLLPIYELKAELAELKEKAGDSAEAFRLYSEAADAAMNDGKMKAATQWSLKAADLEP